MFAAFIVLPTRFWPRNDRELPFLAIALFLSHHCARRGVSRPPVYPSYLLSSPFYSLSPSRNSDPGSHSRLFFPPTHYGSCLAFFFIARRFQLFLPSSTRVEWCFLTHARRSQQLLIFFLFLPINSKSHHRGIRTHGSTLVAFEGYH